MPAPALVRMAPLRPHWLIEVPSHSHVHMVWPVCVGAAAGSRLDGVQDDSLQTQRQHTLSASSGLAAAWTAA